MFRDGPISTRSKSLNWFRVAAFAAAFAAILLVASGAWLWHTDAPGSEATCSICHVAHMPILLGTPTSSLSSLNAVASVAPAVVQFSHIAPAGLSAPPRAPPF
jgi:heme A synthase